MVREAADKGGREWPCLSVRGGGIPPDSAISAASEIGRRKNKSFAQYTGAGWPYRLYRQGLGVHFPTGTTVQTMAQEVGRTSFFRKAPRRPFTGKFSSLPDSIESGRSRPMRRVDHRHSAAAASDGLGVADDSMKSAMRGTISDLNRE